MLVNCVAYEDGRKIADLHPDEISDYLERPHCFVWVALKDPGPGELAQMQHEFGLHDLAVEDAQHGHQRPKIEQYGDSLFAAARRRLQLWDLSDDQIDQVLRTGQPIRSITVPAPMSENHRAPSCQRGASV